MNSRREFLLWMITAGLTINEALKRWNQYKEKDTISKIFKLPNDVHIADYNATSKKFPINIKGAGVVYNDFYLSMAHIPDSLNFKKINTPFGQVQMPLNPKNKYAKMMNANLETLVENVKNDVFIGKSSIKIKNFPCKAKRDVKLGDEVYIIGCPGLMGYNIRKGYVSDLDGYGNLFGDKKNTFGVDFPIHPGDSGCPVVSKDFKLLGLGKYVIGHKFGYINKIGLYLDEIKNIKQKQKNDKLERSKR